MKTMVAVVSTSVMLGMAATAFAQAPSAAPTRAERDSRYQIGMMEGVLEKAVEHGAAVLHERLRTVLPADMLLSQAVRVRGIRLDGYGVIFDIDVPTMLETAPLWSLQTLDQNNLGLESAMNALRAHVNASGDPTLQQALQRMELAVPVPATLVSGSPQAPAARTGAAASIDDPRPAGASSSQGYAATNVAALTELYHKEIIDALIEAMLDHSRGLSIGGGEVLTVVAGGVDSQPLAGLDTDSQTAVISIRGADLAEFLGNRISHDEARQRIQLKVF